MRDYGKQAERLTTSLNLALPPIAVAFPDDVPDGVPAYDGVVPAGCVFWEQAAKGAFVTSAGDHEMCSIGVHTHRLAPAPPRQAAELRTTLEAMSGLDYVREEEVTAIPVLSRQVHHAVYGPLAEFPLDPEAVLLFGHAQQGLVISEAVARVDGAAPPAFGRPACAIVPQVVNQGIAAVSLGCCGARAYLGVFTNSVSLWAFPGHKLERYCREIESLARANETLAAFHERRRRDIATGERPTVQESLQRLG